MREVFPELAQTTIEYAWAGKVAYPVDHLPHAGRLDGADRGAEDLAVPGHRVDERLVEVLCPRLVRDRHEGLRRVEGLQK